MKKEFDEFVSVYKNLMVYYVIDKDELNWNGEVGYVLEEMIKKCDLLK